MGINLKDQRWAEVNHAMSPVAKVEVGYTTVDLSDGTPVFPALTFRIPEGRAEWSGHGGFRFMLSVEDLRELVRLADEEKENLGG